MTAIFRSVSLLLVACTVFGGVAVAQAPAAPAAPQSAAYQPPQDPKAAKLYAEAAEQFKQRHYMLAIEFYGKADKQAEGKCLSCKLQSFKAARQINDFKQARERAESLLSLVTAASDKAQIYTWLGENGVAEGISTKKDKAFDEADAAFRSALEIQPGRLAALYGDGLALAHLHRDGESAERFRSYLAAAKPEDLDYQRAQRYVSRPELARARMAPNFRITTLDGKTVTLESLTGQVGLLDFWATWCGPCKEALPYVQKLARKYANQPFTILSVSIDSDEDADKWKDFVRGHEMTWLQYRDGDHQGPMARLFGVQVVPTTFTIDADGVLQDQHVGDADLDEKIAQLVKRASTRDSNSVKGNGL